MGALLPPPFFMFSTNDFNAAEIIIRILWKEELKAEDIKFVSDGNTWCTWKDFKDYTHEWFDDTHAISTHLFIVADKWWISFKENNYYIVHPSYIPRTDGPSLCKPALPKKYGKPKYLGKRTDLWSDRF